MTNQMDPVQAYSDLRRDIIANEPQATRGPEGTTIIAKDWENGIPAIVRKVFGNGSQVGDEFLPEEITPRLLKMAGQGFFSASSEWEKSKRRSALTAKKRQAEPVMVDLTQIDTRLSKRSAELAAAVAQVNELKGIVNTLKKEKQHAITTLAEILIEAE